MRVVDGRDDGGADILAVRGKEQWVIQAKWSGRGPIDRTGVDDCDRAKALYGADRFVLATNTTLNRTAAQRRDVLAGALANGLSNLYPLAPLPSL